MKSLKQLESTGGEELSEALGGFSDSSGGTTSKGIKDSCLSDFLKVRSHLENVDKATDS
ncbi:MAG: hypothetical protein GY915_01355 [bacterium]|nr:hypothetical protein [bacterium]